MKKVNTLLFRPKKPKPDKNKKNSQDVAIGAQQNPDVMGAPHASSRRNDYGPVWESVIGSTGINVDSYTEVEPFGMTKGRAIAKSLSKFSWYAPRTNAEGTEGGSQPTETSDLLPRAIGKTVNQANLDAAWHYFEHMVLPRRFCTENGEKVESAVDCVKAPPGEAGRPTTLYDPFTTTIHELSDFGIGIGLYFSMLRGLAIVFVFAMLIHVPNYLYFRSSNYSQNGLAGVKTLLQGSAICTENEWVPCPTCRADDSSPTISELWFTSRVKSSVDSGMLFALKNTCGSGDENYLYWRGIISWFGTIFIVIALLAMGEVQRRLQVEFDERNATATDFSICVHNPPPDANNADEWKSYLEKVVETHLSEQKEANFSQRDKHVTLITVALDNHKLTDALTARRKLKKKISDALNIEQNDFEQMYEVYRSGPPGHLGAAMDPPMPSHVSVSPGIGHLFDKVNLIDENIRLLERKEYKVKSIFASFETELGQRSALSALSVSKIDLLTNNTKAVTDARYLFRGIVLDTEEPAEPLTVRWHDLGISRDVRRFRMILTVLLSIFLVIGSFFLVRYVWKTHGAGLSALFITLLNALTPPFCRAITALEVHSDEGKKQASHSIKVLGLRCVNSAIIIHLVTPFPWSLTNGEHLIKAVAAIFFAEILTAPMVQMLDIPGLIKMHVVAPRCKDQQTMNMMFEGGRWELGERYTNMMKICFLCFFFSALFPLAFGLTALLLYIHYQADRFCLMRVWARVPSLGPQVAELNRSYIVPILLATLAVMNAYSWSGFPYDNLCPSNNDENSNYVGKHSISTPAGEVTVNVESDYSIYRACNQDFLSYSPAVFPPLPRFQEGQWMSDGQETITRLHAWTSAIIIGVAIFYVLFFSELRGRVVSIFKSTYEPSGSIYGTDLSDVPGDTFEAYVPQVQVKGFSFPLITCDIRGIHQRFIGWKDEDGDHAEHVLFDDLPKVVTGNNKKPIFSIIKHWDPPPYGSEGYAQTRI